MPFWRASHSHQGFGRAAISLLLGSHLVTSCGQITKDERSEYAPTPAPTDTTPELSTDEEPDRTPPPPPPPPPPPVSRQEPVAPSSEPAVAPSLAPPVTTPPLETVTEHIQEAIFVPAPVAPLPPAPPVSHLPADKFLVAMAMLPVVFHSTESTPEGAEVRAIITVAHRLLAALPDLQSIEHLRFVRRLTMRADRLAAAGDALRAARYLGLAKRLLPQALQPNIAAPMAPLIPEARKLVGHGYVEAGNFWTNEITLLANGLVSLVKGMSWETNASAAIAVQNLLEAAVAHNMETFLMHLENAYALLDALTPPEVYGPPPPPPAQKPATKVTADESIRATPIRTSTPPQLRGTSDLVVGTGAEGAEPAATITATANSIPGLLLLLANNSLFYESLGAYLDKSRSATGPEAKVPALASVLPQACLEAVRILSTRGGLLPRQAPEAEVVQAVRPLCDRIVPPLSRGLWGYATAQATVPTVPNLTSTVARARFGNRWEALTSKTAALLALPSIKSEPALREGMLADLDLSDRLEYFALPPSHRRPIFTFLMQARTLARSSAALRSDKEWLEPQALAEFLETHVVFSPLWSTSKIQIASIMAARQALTLKDQPERVVRVQVFGQDLTVHFSATEAEAAAENGPKRVITDILPTRILSPADL